MSKFNFMVRLDNDKKWQDITEEEAACLLKFYFSDEEIPEKIREIKCGHKYNVRGTQIEAWPKVREN